VGEADIAVMEGMEGTMMRLERTQQAMVVEEVGEDAMDLQGETAPKA